jgi:predicted dehydrogenase
MKKPRAKKVRYAVVGLGHFAQKAVLPAFASTKNSELVALVSDDDAKRKKLARKYRVAETLDYDRLDTFLAGGGADAVYVAVPNSLHRTFTERAARAGAHVLCEKPMAVTVEDCEAMIRVCDQAGVKLMIAYRLHFEEANLRAIELAQSGRLGALKLFDSVFTMQVAADNIRTKGEMGGGPLLDIGVYCINAARAIFRDEPIEVSAFAARSSDRRFRDVDESVNAILRFPRERLASFSVSFGAAGVSTYRVVGSDGNVWLEPAYAYVGKIKQTLTIKGKTREKSFAERDQIAGEIGYFSECVLEDRQPEPSGTEGLADVRVIEAIERSIATGAPVALGGFEKARRPSIDQERREPAHDNPETFHVEAPKDA